MCNYVGMCTISPIPFSVISLIDLIWFFPVFTSIRCVSIIWPERWELRDTGYNIVHHFATLD